DDDLEDFLEGAQAAGEGEEGVAPFFHEGFAVAHAVGDDQLVGEGVVNAFVDHELGGDADDFAAGGAGGVGEGLHEADRVAAVDEGPVVAGDGAAAGFGGVEVVAGDGAAGGAVDGEGFHVCRITGVPPVPERWNCQVRFLRLSA